MILFQALNRCTTNHLPMSSFPLRLYLRNHSGIHRWEELPATTRPLFDGTDVGIRNAEFFIADAAGRKRRFFLTHTVGDALHTTPADVVAIQRSNLVVLVQYPLSKRGTPSVIAFTSDTVLSVAFRTAAPDLHRQ